MKDKDIVIISGMTLVNAQKAKANAAVVTGKPPTSMDKQLVLTAMVGNTCRVVQMVQVMVKPQVIGQNMTLAMTVTMTMAMTMAMVTMAIARKTNAVVVKVKVKVIDMEVTTKSANQNIHKIDL